MRLLHTKTLTFQEFYGSDLPTYAILSHRWGKKEVSLKDMIKKKAKRGPSWAKIRNCCSLAANEGYDWVWIYTCCIDKKSSAEVSEAVNAMYRWYQWADKCYAYLSDVKASEPESFVQSRWFTRGWTLQELLAPEHVVFYDAEWSELGNKMTRASEVTAATGIDEKALNDYYSYREPKACIAKKMYWAAARQTSIPEDMAYCLLGLFGINIPLLYGEGLEKAFLRLQKELLNTTTDETIFAWASERHHPGLLARKPSDFAASGNVENISADELTMRPPWAITNIGFQLTLVPGTWAYSMQPSDQERYLTILVELRCRIVDTKRPIVLTLRKFCENHPWLRRNEQIESWPLKRLPRTETIYIGM